MVRWSMKGVGWRTNGSSPTDPTVLFPATPFPSAVGGLVWGLGLGLNEFRV